MKAPERIYLSDFQLKTISIRPSLDPNTKDFEYNRKDTLIEWLENKIKIPDVSFINGLTYLAYKDVIEHLNEM